MSVGSNKIRSSAESKIVTIPICKFVFKFIIYYLYFFNLLHYSSINMIRIDSHEILSYNFKVEEILSVAERKIQPFIANVTVASLTSVLRFLYLSHC